MELPFHWQIMKPNLRPMPPVEAPEPSQIQFQPETDNAFQISPFSGVFAPYKEKEFLLTFRPKEVSKRKTRLNIQRLLRNLFCLILYIFGKFR